MSLNRAVRPGDRSYVARDGSFVAPEGQPRDAIGGRVDLPVWVGTEVVGHFRLYLSPGPPLSPDRLLAAVGIAEQAGAAFAGVKPCASKRHRAAAPVAANSLMGIDHLAS